MKSNLLKGTVAFFTIILMHASFVQAAMLPLSNQALSKISAKGFSITGSYNNINLYIQNNISIQPLGNSSVVGSAPGITFTLNTNNGISSLTQAQQPSINISGMAGSSFINLNSVNSAINVGVNIIIVTNSSITNFNPTQSNIQNGYNFVNSYFMFNH